MLNSLDALIGFPMWYAHTMQSAHTAELVYIAGMMAVNVLTKSFMLCHLSEHPLTSGIVISK